MYVDAYGVTYCWTAAIRSVSKMHAGKFEAHIVTEHADYLITVALNGACDKTLHSKKCGVHSTPSSCHTIGCVSHQRNFGVLCTPSCGVTGFWCAMHTNCGVLCTPTVVCYAHQLSQQL